MGLAKKGQLAPRLLLRKFVDIALYAKRGNNGVLYSVSGACRHFEWLVVAEHWWLDAYTIQWYNERGGVSNHRRSDCCSTICISKKTSKLRVTDLCEGNPLLTGGFPRKGPETRKRFPFDDVIMKCWYASRCCNFIITRNSNTAGLSLEAAELCSAVNVSAFCVYGDFIPHLTGHVIIYPRWDSS